MIYPSIPPEHGATSHALCTGLLTHARHIDAGSPLSFSSAVNKSCSGKGTRYGLEISLSKWSYKPLNKLTGLSASEQCLGLSYATLSLTTAYKGRVLRLRWTHTSGSPGQSATVSTMKFADGSFGRSLDIHASASLRLLIVYFSCSYHSLVRFSTLSFILSQLPTRLLAREKPSPRLRVRYHLIIGNQYSFRNCSSDC